MKRFYILILLFLCAMFVIDRGFGLATAYLNKNAKGGYTERLRYIVQESEDDILIFGSSRAAHHYDPNVLYDSLSMATYNCGFDGCGIITAYGLYRAIKNRYTPKVIIYEVTPEFDYFEGDNHKYINVLKDFYDYEGVDSVFLNVDKSEYFKMLSYIYRVNSRFVEKIRDNVRPPHSYDKGYDPIDKVMEYEPKRISFRSYETDDLKQYYMETFIKECRASGITLIMTCSPYYSYISTVNSLNLDYAEQLCRKYDVVFLNHSADSSFIESQEYFCDGVHLNRTGATKYTETIASELRSIL